MATELGRFRVHGEKIVWRIADCSARWQDNAAVDAGQFHEQFRSAVDNILALLRRPTRTLTQDSRARRNQIEELNRKNSEFWKGRTQ